MVSTVKNKSPNLAILLAALRDNKYGNIFSRLVVQYIKKEYGIVFLPRLAMVSTVKKKIFQFSDGKYGDVFSRRV